LQAHELRTIRDRYEFVLNNGYPSGDIVEHLGTLFRYASEPGIDLITEFGVHFGCSTTALLMGRPKRMRSYDIYFYPEIQTLIDVCRNQNQYFELIIRSSTAGEIANTDLLFIDSKHTGEQLRKELEMHQHVVRKYIILHDTETFGVFGDDGVPGLNAATTWFLEQYKNVWKLKEHFTNCNGLTIYERI
jgi:hypothetical protein